MEEKNFRYYDFGEFRLDTRRRVLLRDDQSIPISARLFDLLFVLVQNEGRVVEHDELLDKVWGETFVEQSNLKKGVSALRQLLGEMPNQSLYIKTIPRRGYSFVSPVRSFAEGGEQQLTRQVEREIIIEQYEEFEDEPGEILSGNALSESKKNVLTLVPSAAEQPVKTFAGKYKIAVLAALGLFAALAAGLVGVRYFRARTQFANLNQENFQAQKFTGGGNVYDAAISPDGNTVVYAAVEDNGMQSLWLKRVGSANAFALIPPQKIEYDSITFAPDNNSVYYSATLENSPSNLSRISVLGGDSQPVVEDLRSAVTFSPDGRRIAFARDVPGTGRVLLTANAENGGDEQQITVIADNHDLIAPLWSPDGAKFVFIASETTAEGRIWELKEIPATGGEARLLTVPQHPKIYTISWLRDGSGLLMTADVKDFSQTQLWRVSYPGGDLSRISNDVSSYDNAHASADGKVILTEQSERLSDLWSIDAADAANPKRLTSSRNITNRFVPLADGKFVAEAFENGQLSLYSISGGGNLQPLFNGSFADRFPSVSSDGQTLYFVSKRGGADDIWQSNIRGGNAKQLTHEQNFLSFPKASPDGQTLYYLRYDGIAYHLMKMSFGGESSPQAFNQEAVELYDLSPDGRQIAYSFRDEAKKHWQVAVADLTSGSVIRQFDIFPSGFLRWSPDGKFLLYNISDTFREGGNLWRQPLDGGAAQLFLNVEPEKIYSADFSTDGRQIYFSRGKTNSDLILLQKESK